VRTADKAGRVCTFEPNTQKERKVMGKVFSWEEIAAGQVPQIGSFDRVAAHLRQLFTSEHIAASMLCGSILGPDRNIRMDIDCLVLYQRSESRSAQALFNSALDFARQAAVPVELIPIDTEIADTKLHSIGVGFAEHLKRAAAKGGLIKNNPLRLLSLSEHDNLQHDTLNYLRHKLCQLEKGLITSSNMSDERLCRYLQKVLESPIHVGRKMLRWQRQKLKDDSKEEVVSQYTNWAGREIEGRLFKLLIDVDQYYTHALVDVLQHPNQNRYQDLLSLILKSAPTAIEFVRRSCLKMQ